MGEIRFTKMHGIGNDYIYLDCINHTPERLSDLATGTPVSVEMA